MAGKDPPILVNAKYPDHTEYFILLSKEKRFAPLDEKRLVREIPGYNQFNERTRKKKFRKFIKHSNIVSKFHLPDFLPNAPKELRSPRKQAAAAKELLSVCTAFESPYTGYLLLSDILCAMHGQALRQAEPGFHPVITVSSDRPEIVEIFKTLVKSTVTMQTWRGKRVKVDRKAILDFRVPPGSYPRHLQSRRD